MAWGPVRAGATGEAARPLPCVVSGEMVPELELRSRAGPVSLPRPPTGLCWGSGKGTSQGFSASGSRMFFILESHFPTSLARGFVRPCPRLGRAARGAAASRSRRPSLVESVPLPGCLFLAAPFPPQSLLTPPNRHMSRAMVETAPWSSNSCPGACTIHPGWAAVLGSTVEGVRNSGHRGGFPWATGGRRRIRQARMGGSRAGGLSERGDVGSQDGGRAGREWS